MSLMPQTSPNLQDETNSYSWTIRALIHFKGLFSQLNVKENCINDLSFGTNSRLHIDRRAAQEVHV